MPQRPSQGPTIAMSLFARKKLRNKQVGNPDHPQTFKSIHLTF